jgi:hypothetical protein
MTAPNLTSNSVAQPLVYRDAVLALVGEQDPIAVVSELLDAVHAGVAAVPRTALETPEAPGKWSALQVVQHLADTELAFGWRVRQILTADRPPLHGFDENVWMTRLRRDDHDLGGALAQLAALRRELVRILKGCTSDDFARVGIHSERGEESLGLITRLIAGHDLVHRRQLARIAVAVRAAAET